MIKAKLERIYSILTSIAFSSLFLFLPVTSLPLLSKIFGGTSVAPLSVVPALLLVIVLIIPTVFNNRLFSVQFTPLILFILSALISTFFVFFRDAPTFKDIHFLKNAIESGVTLLMGLAFYYLCAHFLNTEDKIKQMMRWMNIGAFILIAFSAIQAFYMYTPFEIYPNWLKQATWLTASSGKIFPRRISGLAYEPSWLAHQLNLLYLPIWLGFSVKKHSVYSFRLFKNITIENILLVFGVGLLFLSFSRIGWITFFILLVFLLIRIANILLNRIISGIEAKRKKRLNNWQSLLAKAGMWVAVIIVASALGIIAGLVIAKLDPKRTANLLNIEAIKNLGILGWANLLKIAERFIYWIIGFKAFQLHPWLGVGLGAVGYYFPSLTPAFGYLLPDLVHIINIESFIPNAKNLWSRLLGETGIIGTAFFVGWIYMHFKNAYELERQHYSSFLEAMGLVGKLFVLAFIIEGFSMDTFGLPYYWIAFGLIVASWRISKNKEETNVTGQQSSD